MNNYAIFVALQRHSTRVARDKSARIGAWSAHIHVPSTSLTKTVVSVVGINIALHSFAIVRHHVSYITWRCIGNRCDIDADVFIRKEFSSCTKV